MITALICYAVLSGVVSTVTIGWWAQDEITKPDIGLYGFLWLVFLFAWPMFVILGIPGLACVFVGRQIKRYRIKHKV